MKKQKKTTIWVIVLCFLIIAGVAGYFILRSNVKSFKGVADINDEIKIEDADVHLFDFSAMTAKSTPTTVGEALDDITIFKSEVENTLKGLTEDDSTMVIPAIAVMFELGSSELNSTSRELLAEFSNVYCSTNKQSLIAIDAYTCDLGSESFNVQLSDQRANSVKVALIEQGVPADKIAAKGYGESMYGKLDVIGREQYRRANISIK